MKYDIPGVAPSYQQNDGVFVFLCPPALFDAENRQQMVMELRLKAQRIVAVMWWDMRREHGRLVTGDPVIYLTANYDTHGPNFGQMAQGARRLSTGEGAHRRVWGMRNRVVVRVEQRRRARPVDDPRPVVLPTTGAGVPLGHGHARDPVVERVRPARHRPAVRSLHGAYHLERDAPLRVELDRMARMGSRQGRGRHSCGKFKHYLSMKTLTSVLQLQALCRERALASNIIINYRKRHRDAVPSFDNGRSFAQSCQPAFDQSTRAYNDHEVAPTLSIKIDQGRNRFLEVAMEREPTGAVLARMVRQEGRAQPERESEIRFAAVEPEEW